MRIAKFIGAASVAALLTFPSTATLAETTDLVTVTVVGSGANEAEARLDAIRQATQQVASQVVVAERRIVDDEVVYDNVMSTMNGFVHDFTELGVTKSGTEVQIKAEVVVSGSLMRDFASGQASSVAVDGGGMFGELLRSKSQAEVHQKMFESIWRRYTSGVSAEIQIKDYTLQSVSFDLEIKWSSDFIFSIISFFDEIAYATCPTPDHEYYDIEEIYSALKYDPMACDSRLLTASDALERFEKSNSMLVGSDSYYYFNTSFSYFCQSGGVCYLMDPLSIYPLISSEIPYYEANKWEPQPVEVTRHTPTGDLYVSKGTDPFGLNLKISFFDEMNGEIKNSIFSVPLATLTRQQVDYPRDEHILWHYELTLRNSGFTVTIPLSEIDIRRVHHVSVEVLG